MANTSTTVIVYSSTNFPNIRPMTSKGTPALQCFNIFNKANDDMCIVSAVSVF